MNIYNFDNLELKRNNEDIEENLCLLCHKPGLEVRYDTVLSLSNDFIKTTLKYDHYYLCLNKNCEVAYFTEDKKILINEIKVPLWFKENKSKFIVCYCRDITLDNIINSIKYINGQVTIDKVVKYLGKDNIPTNCLLNMPTGDSCKELFLNAIEYAIKIISKL